MLGKPRFRERELNSCSRPDAAARGVSMTDGAQAIPRSSVRHDSRQIAEGIAVAADDVADQMPEVCLDAP